MRAVFLVIYLSTATAVAVDSEFEFVTEATVLPGEAVYVVGDLAELGAWNFEHALKLVKDLGANTWRLNVALPAGSSFDYRYLARDNRALRIGDPANGEPLGPILSAATAPGSDASGTVYLDSTWSTTPVIHWRNRGESSFTAAKMALAAASGSGVTHVAMGVGSANRTLEFYLTDSTHASRVPQGGVLVSDEDTVLVARGQVFNYLPAAALAPQQRAYPPAAPFRIDSVILQENRVYRVMLPRGYYEHPQRRYPLLLIHDGLVHWDDGFTSGPLDPDGDVSAREVARGEMREVIQVAIDPLEGSGCAFDLARARDYFPNGSSVQLGACGLAAGRSATYADFLELELVPSIAGQFRVADGPAISVGFSAGGLVSLTLGTDRPHFVNRAGSLSGSVYVGPLRNALLGSVTAMERIYLDSGTDADLFETNQSLRDGLLGSPNYMVLGRELNYRVCPNGAHQIFDWRRRMGAMLSYLAPANEAENELPVVAGAEILPGLWYDRARNGHGFDLHRAGNRYILVFYTYGEDGLPEWFIATATVIDGELVAEEGLLRFTMDPTQTGGAIADPSFTGDFSLDVTAAEADPACNDGTDRGGAKSLAVFSWQVRDTAGAWCVEPLVTLDDTSRPNFGGLWYDPADSGWGFSTHFRGDPGDQQRAEFGVLYFYDGNGQPRWAIGSSAAGTTGTLEMLSFTGYCPSCEALELVANSSGSLSHDLDPPGEFGIRRSGLVEMSITPEATPGTWSRAAPITQLSEAADPPETPRAAHQRIAFVTDRDGNDEIYTIDADGVNLRRLTRDVAIDGGPAWSPGRDRIAFHSERSGRFAIYVADLEGNIEQLTDDPAPEGFPTWSPDGGSVMFSSLRAGGETPDLYLLNLASGGVTRQTDQGAIAGSWSPDGSAYVYQGQLGQSSDIFVLELATGEARNLTNDTALDEYPSWSPDGELIVFESGQSGPDDLITIRPDGSDRRNLTNTPARDENQPAWSPDGSAIVFRADAGGGVEALMRMDLTSGRITRLTFDADAIREIAWR